MIDISKLYCGGYTNADTLRYGNQSSEQLSNSIKTKYKNAAERRPIVVWNTTKQCNLKCLHCYSSSDIYKADGELSTARGFNLIDQLSAYQVPSLLFSGGEPLMRKDILKLIEYAAQKGLRTVISTNGTLLTRQMARDLKSAGLIYAGISLDGMKETNDKFRGTPGAFNKTLSAFENCSVSGLKAGLRMTLTRQNYFDLEKIFNFINKMKIQRACFYHLVYAGRGKELVNNDLSHAESRDALDKIIDYTKKLYANNNPVNILTVDNHVDGVYLYLKAQKNNHPEVENIYKLLKWNGGAAHSTGVGIAAIDYLGNVHADQFWWDYSFGNILERDFGDIWSDESDKLMYGLKHKAQHLKGRCRLCKYKELCCGAMRIRALKTFNDLWAPDPQCYLTDEEIGLTEEKLSALTNSGENYA